MDDILYIPYIWNPTRNRRTYIFQKKPFDSFDYRRDVRQSESQAGNWLVDEERDFPPPYTSPLGYWIVLYFN
jgi:hypothetical protein